MAICRLESGCCWPLTCEIGVLRPIVRTSKRKAEYTGNNWTKERTNSPQVECAPAVHDLLLALLGTFPPKVPGAEVEAGC